MSRTLAAGVGLLTAVGVMAVAVPMEPLPIDRAWSEAMHDIRAAWLTRIALVFDWLGHGLGWLLTLGSIAGLLLLRRLWAALAVFAAAEALSAGSSALLKSLVGRPRPPHGLVDPVGSAFPSGHSSYAAVTSVALVLLFAQPGRARRRWWAVGVFATATMAWSRTYLQVHWLTDVVGGSLLGAGIALTVFGAVYRTASRPGHRLRATRRRVAP